VKNTNTHTHTRVLDKIKIKITAETAAISLKDAGNLQVNGFWSVVQRRSRELENTKMANSDEAISVRFVYN
jgi:hypothetical protein